MFFNTDYYMMGTYLLFFIGVYGISRNRSSLLLILMCIELLLLAISLQLIMYSVYSDDMLGQIFSLMVLTVAAGESSLGLAIMVIYFRVHGTISMRTMNLLHGWLMWIMMY